MAQPPCIKVAFPSALKPYKNGQLPEELLAKVKTGGKMYAPAAEQFNKMYDAALAAGHKLRNVGDYRSYQGQLNMFLSRYSTTDMGRKPQVRRTFEGKYWYLKPGMAPSATPDPSGKKGSNHGWGLAIDLAYEQNGKLIGMGGACFDWLCENAPKFGFYLQTSDRKSKFWEAWHWQYCLGDKTPDGSAYVPPKPPPPLPTTGPYPGHSVGLKHKHDVEVKMIQTKVGATVDGDYGNKTKAAVAKWQTTNGLPASGEVDKATWEAMFLKAEAPKKTFHPMPPTHAYPGTSLRIGSKGADVKLVQGKVGAKPDGDFGPKTSAKVKAWQRANAACCGSADGVVGPKTWKCMFG